MKTIEWQGHTLQEVEVTKCRTCFFFDLCTEKNPDNITCMPSERADGKNIYYKEVNNDD